MKTLVFMRHAKSDGVHQDLTDRERPLTIRRRQEVLMMAREISRRAIRPDCIVSSPAVRALATAQIAAGEMGFPDDAIRVEPTLYEASIHHYLEVITTLPDEARAVLLVGHNPTLTELVNILAPASVSEMPAGGVAAIGAHVERWSQVRRDCGTLMFFKAPNGD